MTSVCAWDTETALIRPGVQAPELACISYATPAPDVHAQQFPALLVSRIDGPSFIRELLATNIRIVGHNISYDFAVMCQHDPSLIPSVFKAYRDERIYDTQLRQQLLDIAAGRFYGEWNGHRFIKYRYNLDALAQRLCGWRLDKDTWRLRYGELLDTPLHEWPEGARTYPLDDARATLGVFLAQEEHTQFLADQHRQVRRAWWLRLMSAWGLRTSPVGVEAFTKEVDARMGELEKELIELGLIRANGVRDTKSARKLMVDVCLSKGLPVIPTDTMVLKIKGGESFNPMLLEGVCMDADACKHADDWRLDLYSEFSTLKTVQSKDVPLLQAGTVYPVHSRFDIVESGRTSSSGPNVQNIRTLPGIRECFVPRMGKVFMQADYPGLELRTLAQVCINLLGYSRLGEALNDDKDPHLMLTANMLGISYEDAVTNKKDPEIKKSRDMAKRANFGFAGGAGIATFRAVAAMKPYYMQIDEPTARFLKAKWMETWPEMRQYFDYISKVVGDGRGTVEQMGSGRIRAGLRYTEACNTYFQGLGADATSAAGWLICNAMYNDPPHILYGSRLVNFVHDEFIAECDDDDQASDRVLSMCQLMIEGANAWLPSVPFTKIEPVLMSHWSKNAESKIIDGKVQVWRG